VALDKTNNKTATEYKISVFMVPSLGFVFGEIQPCHPVVRESQLNGEISILISRYFISMILEDS